MSKIEWTEKTWNPIVGCSIVSPGCTNCYAMRQAERIEKMNPDLAHYRGLTQPSKAGPVWTGKVALSERALLEPLRRRKPTTWFVNSMGDLFHEDAPDEWIDRVFAVMALCPQHTFQCLTKRSRRMKDYFDDPRRRDLIAAEFGRVGNRLGRKNLAAGEARRQSAAQFCDQAVRSHKGGIHATAGLSVDHDDDRRSEDHRVGSSRDLDAFQRSHPGAYDDKSQERCERRQSSRQSGTGDDVAAESARGFCSQRQSESPDRQQESEDCADRDGRAGDQGSAIRGDDGQGHRREICNGPTRDLSDHHSQELATHLNWPLPNVWLGVSAEDQRRADERIPDLLATPAAVRFVSAEPLLGPIDFTRVGSLETISRAVPAPLAREQHGRPRRGDGSICNAQIDAIGNAGSSILFFQTPDHMGGFTAISPREWPRIDWIIVGGESGPNARPMQVPWARSIVQQCKASGVACFVKQLGADPIWEDGAFLNLAHRKGADMAEWPDDLRVREVPDATA